MSERRAGCGKPACPVLRGAEAQPVYGRDPVAPSGNQTANGEHKLRACSTGRPQSTRQIVSRASTLYRGIGCGPTPGSDFSRLTARILCPMLPNLPFGRRTNYEVHSRAVATPPHHRRRPDQPTAARGDRLPPRRERGPTGGPRQETDPAQRRTAATASCSEPGISSWIAMPSSALPFGPFSAMPA